MKKESQHREYCPDCDCHFDPADFEQLLIHAFHGTELATDPKFYTDIAITGRRIDQSDK